MEEAGDGSPDAPERGGEARGVGRRGGKGEEPTGGGGEGEEDTESGGDTEVGIYGGFGGAVSGDDDVLGEPDGETGGDEGVGYVGQVICVYAYVPLNGIMETAGCVDIFHALSYVLGRMSWFPYFRP